MNPRISMTPVTEDQVRDALASVIDPELGLNLVELGLIYGIEIESGRVTVRMTLTTQGCPMHESLIWGVRRAVLAIEGVTEVDVQLVWDPPWHPGLLSPEAREQLGAGN